MNFDLFRRKKNDGEREISLFYKIGFHGDQYLIALVDMLLKECQYFIETGTNVASTLAFVAEKYPSIQCLSCEPDKASFDEARKNTAKHPNVKLYNLMSQDFMHRIIAEKGVMFDKGCLFWLDAHGYGFQWPLKEELAFITRHFKSAYILIDDFKVPGLDCFGYDAYADQECSFEFIKNDLNSQLHYNVYYPDYTERTSAHHPLRGWGLIEFGHKEELKFPDSLMALVRQSKSV